VARGAYGIEKSSRLATKGEADTEMLALLKLLPELREKSINAINNWYTKQQN
jgi:hypothetical protein